MPIRPVARKAKNRKHARIGALSSTVAPAAALVDADDGCSSGSGSNRSRVDTISASTANPISAAPISAPRQPPNHSANAVMTGGASAQPILPVMPWALNAGPRRLTLTDALRMP